MVFSEWRSLIFVASDICRSFPERCFEICLLSYESAKLESIKLGFHWIASEQTLTLSLAMDCDWLPRLIHPGIGIHSWSKIMNFDEYLYKGAYQLKKKERKES